MFGGVGKSAGWATILVAGGIILGGSISAKAADLGGDCCADLEERVAELEATTARKGNKKVSLTVYGQVNEALMWWDDGAEQNVYQVTNDNSRTRFGFKGSAKIAKDWKAGYVLEIGVRGASSKRSNQFDSQAVGARDIGLDVRHSRWYIESKHYGEVSVGVTPTAMESATEQNLAHTKDIAKYSDVEDSGLGMIVRSNGVLSNGGGADDSIISWRRLIKDSGDPPGEGERRPGVWYVSPEFNGFNVEAGWGADDGWDVGLKYKGEFDKIKVLAAVAYGENTDAINSQGFSNFFECLGTAVTGAPDPDADCHAVGASMSMMHEPTGLYFNLAGGWQEDERIPLDVAFRNNGGDDESTFWAIEVGIEKKFIEIGKTTFFGQYYDLDGGASERRTVAAADPINPLGENAHIFSTGVQMWGGGVIQELSKVINLYAYYRHYEGELALTEADGTPNGAGADGPTTVPIDDLDVVMSGALIKF